ncbi:MAG: 3'(2'),5'-bisphosphate nucleotidase CysQ [Acidobacteria bacterium]|nr:3'(2'),5'-bisphosphate nucleotidase CysQ [Acidobacteriota bacterium]
MTVDDAQLPALLDAVGALAGRAGEAILATVRSPGEFEEKADGSPVTRADRAAHEILVEGLSRLDPGHTVVSEEGDVEGTVRVAGSVYWLVDPLDGTKEFIAGRPEYTVNVALVEKGVPILGVIQVPVNGRLYLGARGHGARLVDGEGEAPLTPASVDRPLTAVVSRSHLNARTEEFLGQLGITETTPCGSSLKICAVAEGVADVYPRFGPTCLWDTAAGAAIATAAGCSVVDLEGQPLRYDPANGIKHAGFLVAAPGGCLDACLPALRAASS